MTFDHRRQGDGIVCRANLAFEDAAQHYTRALEWGLKSNHLTPSKQSALYLLRASAHLNSGDMYSFVNLVSLSIASGVHCPQTSRQKAEYMPFYVDATICGVRLHKHSRDVIATA